MNESNYKISDTTCNNMQFDKLTMPVNTKGTVYANDGNAVGFLPVGINGQFLTADSAVTLGVKWADKPGGVATNSNQTLIGSIEAGSGGTRYTCYDFGSSNSWNSDRCEGIPQAFNATIQRFSVCKGGNTTWTIGVGQTLQFTIGRFTGIGQPSSGGFTFTAYSGGPHLTITNSSNGTRDTFVVSLNIAVLSGETVCVRAVDSGTGMTGFITTVTCLRSDFS